MDINKDITVYFDDFNSIECTQCKVFFHPEEELKHLESIKHKNKITEIELYKHLSESDMKLIKKFKKILKNNFKNIK
jgi:hypothetical protein